MAEYSYAVLAYLGLVGALAGLARGFSGFGAALIFVPMASVAVGPALAAPVFLIIDLIVAAPLIRANWRRSNHRDVGLIALGAVVGAPLGTWVLTHAEPTDIRWSITIINLALLAVLASGWRYEGQPRPAVAVGVGWSAGLLHGIAQASGPPVVAYWLGGRIPMDIFRANVILYFGVQAAITGIFYFAAGLLPAATLLLSLVVLPAYTVGLWLGGRLFNLASEATFRRLCYVLIAGAALLSVPLFD